ncbi:DHA2 family efflux MFS transporter permease subunit [Chitinophaga filiformis]|uniref:DHA2 family efflux MFS transporter permease subunit n=1 Tax=Chitinophaga filiformis TaxID=104663 RepID=UPI001F462BD3|nr:DHA2 family efflux MFS transporter permease subunit [Chitinophaga filiformis]MCF6407332.1 DHA2 family efflux MFS transporter permease subunit [Chitinophaga filiformis]
MEQLPSLVEYGFRRALITLIAIICALLSVMDISIANVAFSDIRWNLGVSPDEVSWVMTAYSLANIVIMPFSNWLSRRIGRRNYFAISVMLFTVCSFFCGNAVGIQELVTFRFLQGLGGGGMLVLSHTIVTESWPGKKRATSQAFFTLGVLAAGALASPFGGYITNNYSWPFIFFVNIPVGVILCVLILTCVRNGSYEKGEDWLSTIMLAVGTSCLYIIIARGHRADWFSRLFFIALLVIGLTGIAFFIYMQLIFRSRLEKASVLRRVSLRTGLILSFITALSVAASSIVFMSLLGWATQLPAIPLWTNIGSIVVMLAVTALLIEREKALKYLIATGMLFFAIYAYMLYRTAFADLSPVYVLGLLVIRNLAVGILSVSLSTLTLSTLEGKQVGHGTALYNIIKHLGGALGIALFSARLNQQVDLTRLDSAYITILIIGIIFLVCIPFVLYFVKEDDH